MRIAFKVISILLPTLNRIDLFPQAYGSCLFNLQDCPEEYEFIIVNDNKWPSEIHDTLNRMAIKYIQGPSQGSASAFQCAADAASGEKLLFINDDLIFYQPFIKPLLEAYDKGYGIVGSKLLYENMTIQHAGMEFLPQFEWTSSHLNRGYPHDAPEVNEFKEMPCVTFSLTLVDAKLFYDMEGFNPSYGGENYSDTDFCLTALENGAKIAYEPRSEAIHLESATRGHNMEKNTETFGIFKSRWVRNGRLQKLLKEKGFIYA